MGHEPACIEPNRLFPARDRETGCLGVDDVRAAVACLDEIGEDGLRADVLIEAVGFFRALARVPSLRSYRGWLTRRCPVACDDLVELLMAASDAYRCAIPVGWLDAETLDRFADSCLRLASFIGAALDAVPPWKSGIVVQIERDASGSGEIVVIHLTEEERKALEKARSRRRRRRRS